ncbi:hypothetical protein OnM2_073069, partial [Erysiphe neolycopersici]
MSGTDAILAAIKDLKLHQNSTTLAGLWNKDSKKINDQVGQSKSQQSKPRAPWRKKSEFYRLIEENRCVRCTEAGH